MSGVRSSLEVVGLVPAAGQAKRLAPLPFSKEVYPVGFLPVEDGHGARPKVVSHYLLEKMRLAGARKAYIVLRDGKWDIPAYFGDGHRLDMHLAYLMMRLPFGVPYTLDQAYPFLQRAMVVFGFPDLLFNPDDAFVHVLNKQKATGADIVLGLFPSDQPYKMDMVELDGEGRVRSIVIKPDRTQLQYTWLIGVWTPTFTRFMHDYLKRAPTAATDDEPSDGRELFVGDVVQAAVEREMNVETVIFPDERCVDIGTSEDLVKAIRENVGIPNREETTAR